MKNLRTLKKVKKAYETKYPKKINDDEESRLFALLGTENDSVLDDEKSDALLEDALENEASLD